MLAQSAADLLQTNDQVLSLTDQLNLGVRLVELDTHWVKVRLREGNAIKTELEAAGQAQPQR